MKAALISVLFPYFLASILHAQVTDARPGLPDEAVIRDLITLAEEIKSDRIDVAVVLRGELHGEGEFVCRDAARATLVMPVIEAGRKVRRVEERVFLWNEKWGWFTYRHEQRRGGEVILVFSEKKGLVAFD